MPDFAQGLVRAVLSTDGGDAVARRLSGRAVADTLAVAAAGFDTEAVRRTAGAIATRGAGIPAWDGTPTSCLEDAAMLNAAAAHALDFDDLDTVSSVHLSAVVLPALCSGHDWPSEDALLAALRAGLMLAQGVARRLGRGHYGDGWHATATIGVLAATAAMARAERLPPAILTHALALAAAQSAGLQANFGTMAKALQAGFAAAAAVRSIRLAKAGITGGAVFAPGGYFALYAGDDGCDDGRESWEVDAGTIVPKLFPCCFAAHRMIAAALQARETLEPAIAAPDMRVIVAAPRSSLRILHVDRPATALEAAFSARYCVAAALRDGAPTLRHFADPLDPALLAMLDRVTLLAHPVDTRSGMDEGSVTITVGTVAGERHFTQTHLPGHADDAATDALLRNKIADCLAVGDAVAAPLVARLNTLPLAAPWLAPAASAGDAPTSG